MIRALEVSGLVSGLMLLPFLLVLLDVVPAALAALRGATVQRDVVPEEDFTVLVPIYGDVRYLENLDFLAEYGSQVMLCTTSGESAEFYGELEELARTHGFVVFRAVFAPTAGASGRQTGGVTRDRVIREALRAVTTTYSICLDADTVTAEPVATMVGRLAHRGLDLASVRLTVANRGSLLARLQAHEYRMSMRLRRVMPWLCSGACHLGRTAVLRDVMAHHSTFFQGNDAELGLLGARLGHRIGHLDAAVPTTVPESVGPWWRQRFAWAGGEFRLYVVNARMILRHPWFILYGAVLVFAMTPLRVASVATPTASILLVLAAYWLVVVGLNLRHLDLALLLYPAYGLFNSLVLIPLGVVSYARMALVSRNAGLISVRRTSGLVATAQES